MSRNESLQFINLAHFFDHFFLLIFPTAALALAPVWGMTYADVLLFGMPLYVMFALGTLPAGWLGDRFDRMKLMILFFVGCGASSVLVALATGPLTLMIGLGFLGLFTSLYHPVGLAHVTIIGTRPGRALAINGVFGNMGLAGAALFTGILAENTGWQSAFALPGIVSIILGAILYLRNRDQGKTLRAPLATIQKARVNNSRHVQILVFGVVCVAALFSGIVFNAITISLPKFFDERLAEAASDLTLVGASTGAVFAIAAFAQLPVGDLLDRFGARPILIILLTAEVFLLLSLSTATGWVALVLALALVAVMFAGIPITSWLLGHYVDTDLRSRAVSVEYILSLGMGGAAVLIISLMHSAGYGFQFQFVALAASTLIVLLAAFLLPGGRAGTLSVK